MERTFCTGDPDWRGPHHCAACAAQAEALCAAFDAAVARGEMDEEGYTPNERKAATRRLQEKGRLF